MYIINTLLNIIYLGDKLYGLYKGKKMGINLECEFKHGMIHDVNKNRSMVHLIKVSNSFINLLIINNSTNKIACILIC